MRVLAKQDLYGDPVHRGKGCPYGNNGNTCKNKAEINEYKVADRRKEYGCRVFLTEE